MDPERVRAIAEWPIPRTFRDIQVFLGFCGFYRRFIHQYSKLTAPLTDLLKGSQNGKKPGSVTLNEAELKTFEALVNAFKKAPILRHFDPQRHTCIETDASDMARAAILSQPDDQGIYHPEVFFYQSLKELRSTTAPPIRSFTPSSALSISGGTTWKAA